MKDLPVFNHAGLYAMLLFFSVIFFMFVVGVCESRAFDATHPTPKVEDLWNVCVDDLKVNRVCRYLVENGWVSDNVDEETFHYEVTMIMQMSGQFDKVAPEFALAIAAHESHFRPDALSPAGARGIFQLLPSYHAERLIQYIEEDEAYTDDRFYEPLLNVMAGMDYLNYILGEVDGNHLATCMWYDEGPVKGMDRFECGVVSTYASSVTALEAELESIIHDPDLTT